MTLHQHGYIPSVFDVVHDAGRSTALFSSKDKFVLFDQSYDQTNGAANEHGRDKIDMFFTEDDGPPKFSQTMNERFIAEMGSHHFNYAFVHYRDADSVGTCCGGIVALIDGRCKTLMGSSGRVPVGRDRSEAEG